jgi:peptide/nickel transport system substrate-binding protein
MRCWRGCTAFAREGNNRVLTGQRNGRQLSESSEGVSEMKVGHQNFRHLVSTGVSRRTLLKTTGGGLGLLLLQPGATAAQEEGSQLVIGANFVIQSLDPGRSIETTTNMVNHSTYDSLVTFDGEDLTTPKPRLASEWTVSEDGTSYTFTLQPDVTFASGNPLTSADVKWSFDRVRNLQSNPLFLVEKITGVEAPDPQTVVITLDTPYPGILPILASPSLGILDSALVSENGGTDAADAAETDTAEEFLNSQSAGSGPYMTTSYLPDQEVVLERNPNYWREPGAFDRIVIRNITEAATQKLQIEAGDIDIATGLSQDQVPTMEGSEGVTVNSSAAATTFYVLMNNNPDVGGAFSNPLIQQAVRYALKYDEILAIAGPGATRLAGIIPTVFPGALDPAEATVTDQEQARSLVSEAALDSVTGQLSYASDSVIWGVQMNVLAQKIQSDLAEVGIELELDGLPRTTALQKYRDAENQVGVWSWAADFPDASNFLVYLPGRTVGTRAGWPADASPETEALVALGEQAEATVDDEERIELYQEVETTIREIGPYAPLFQPAVPYAFRSDLTGVTFNSVWGVDLYAVARTA